MGEVVITGLGVVSPLGHDVESFWQALLAGTARPRRVTTAGLPQPAPLYSVLDHPVADGDAGLGRATQFALAAAGSALRDSGLSEASRSGTMMVDGADGCGLSIGIGTGDGDLLEARRDGRRTDLTDLDWWQYGTAGTLAHRFGLHGPNLTVATACSAGAYAVATAAEAIADGEADVMLAGGTEGVSRPAMAAFARLGAGDPERCRPFDADRRGTVYGEGAAVLVLESEEHAAARGARVHARWLGSGWSCDGHHPTAPDASGEQALRAAAAAMTAAGCAPADVAAVICHGTGTPLNDAVESRTMARVFGDRLAEVPMTAIKAALGHSGAAAGAFACLVAGLVLTHRQVPPTAELDRIDPDCALRIVRERPAATGDGHVLVNAYAFGGNNISLLLGAA